MNNKTLNLDEAADFLDMHKETLRLKARRGEIPGRKPGKRWVFSQLALQRYLAGEWTPRVVECRKEENVCHSTKETIARIGITRYTRPAEVKSYEEALAPRTKGRPRSSMTA